MQDKKDISTNSKSTDNETRTAIAFTDLPDSHDAGQAIASQIQKGFSSEEPDVIIVFASSSYNYQTLLKTIDDICKPTHLVGCSSAGEFTSNIQGEGSVSAVAIKSGQLKFSTCIGKNIHNDQEKAARDVVENFDGMDDTQYPYRSALVLTDALAGYTDALIDHLNQMTAGTYQFFGGGAGDDAKFSQTHVFMGTESYTDAVVALEILSKKPIGVGVRHCWEVASEPMRVTESDGMRLISLNASPAKNVLIAHAKATAQDLNEKEPIPFFLHNVLGIGTPSGYKLRVPLAILEDGSVQCASDIPTGSTIYIMKTTSQSAAKAAKDATDDALRQLGEHKSSVALVFDCVATRLRTGREFNNELDAISAELKETKFVGCNTYGQISRVDGQFNGFHNCTAVICLLPK